MYVNCVPLMFILGQPCQRAGNDQLEDFANHRGKRECLQRKPVEPELDKGASQKGH